MKKGRITKKSQSLIFAVLIILIAFAVIISCENKFVIDILPDRETKKPEVPQEPETPVIPIQPQVYTIVIDISDNETGDNVTVSPNNGKEGDTVTLTYIVANRAHYNLLDFGGVTSPVASVYGAENGTRTYAINPADASNGVITITAVFTHTNLVPDNIAFSDTAGHITKTYGDAVFTNAIAAGYFGNGAITYSSSNTTVAAVDGLGQVTILKTGSAIITAEKAADAVYAHAQTNYTLTVAPKPVTIIGLSADDKIYDGTTTATVTGTAVIDGLVDGDAVTIVEGVAEFEDADVGDEKSVTFSGWSLEGADADNYTLSAQPASVTASITNLVIDHIAFNDTEGHITKTYGDAAFTNAVTDAHNGNGAITYSSSDTTVATVDGSGKVTIIKAGSAVITAEKAADAVYAHAHTNYTLTVNPKPVTITGLSASNKVYDGTTAATVTGTAVINGLVVGDNVTVSAGTAAFANKTVGTGKAVTFSGYSLSGADAANYGLSAQPNDVTANITAKPVTITGLSASNKQYDGTTTATVNGAATINGLVVGDNVTVSAGTASFADASIGNGKTVTFNGWSLTGADAGNYSLTQQPASVTANITKITGAAVSKPVVSGSPTSDSITVNAVSLQTATGQSVEYAISRQSNGTGLSWQDGTVFTGLYDDYTYYVYARSKENATYAAGPVNMSAGIKTAIYKFPGAEVHKPWWNGSPTSDTITVRATSLQTATGQDIEYAISTANNGTGLSAWQSGLIFTGLNASTTYYVYARSKENATYTAGPINMSDGIKTASMMEMVSIPAGTFQMGSPTTEPNRNSYETQHTVTLSKSFYMSKYQVTQKQYQEVMGAGEDRTTTTYGKGNNYPVYYVSWYDAIVFCNKLSMMEGLNPVYSINGSTDPAVWIANNGGSIPTSGNATWNSAVMDTSKNGYRLPTEAEWEYACRGSYTNKAMEKNTKPFGIGDGTKITGSMANFDGKYPYDLARSGQYDDAGGTYLGRTTTVGSYTANNYGLYDMHGNVYEWCWDWYDSSYYSSSPTNDPMGASSGSYRVRRGGGWNDSAVHLRSAYRYYGYPYSGGINLGFRLVRP